jgi:hypothetical protein
MMYLRQLRQRDWRIPLIAMSLLALLWLQGPKLGDPFQLDEDFRSFYWMNKFQDPSLFPRDLQDTQSYGYFDADLPWGSVPLQPYSLGYGLLFYAASFFMTPVLFSKILPFLLMPITVNYCYEFGRSVRDRSTGVALAAGFILLNLASPTSLSLASGLQRSFACPLMIALLYYLHRRRFFAAAAVIPIAALLYPPAFLLAATTWGLSSMKLECSPNMRLRIISRRLYPLLLAFLLSAAILSPILLSDRLVHASGEDPGRQDALANAEPHEHLWDNPRYGTGGRQPLFYLFPFIGRGGLVNKAWDALHLLLLAYIALWIVLIRPRRALDLPAEAWCMLCASFVTYGAAWVGIWLTNSFLLHLPSRYTRVGLFLFLLVFVCLNLRDAVREAIAMMQRNRRGLTLLIATIEGLSLTFVLLYPSDRTMLMGVNMKWLLVPASLLLGVFGVIIVKRPRPGLSHPSKLAKWLGRVFIGLVMALFFAGWGAHARSAITFLNPSAAERKLLEFVETLPEDVLLAGTPCALDNVPLFAKRQILFGCEKISADTSLMHDALRAYYAESNQVVVDFCQERSIDYLVVDLRTYSDDYLSAEWVFYEPLNQVLLSHIAGQDAFALAHVPDTIKMFQLEHYYVVACADLGTR